MTDVFTHKTPQHNLRKSNCIMFPPPTRRSKSDAGNIRFIGQGLLQKLPDELKESPTLNIFMDKMEQTELD